MWQLSALSHPNPELQLNPKIIARKLAWEGCIWLPRRLYSTVCRSVHPFQAGLCRAHSKLCHRFHRHVSCRTIASIHVFDLRRNNLCSSNCTVLKNLLASSRPHGTLVFGSGHVPGPNCAWLLSYHLAAVQFHCSYTSSQCQRTLLRQSLPQCERCWPRSRASSPLRKRLPGFPVTHHRCC